MWLLLFLLFFQASPSPCQTPPPPAEPSTLIVQVVDPNWIPAQGIEVTVKSVTGNARPNSDYTDKDGYAKFFVPVDADYSVEAKWPGFKNARLKGLHLFKGTGAHPTVYVQLRLVYSQDSITVY
jgi:hypothetical protein